MDKRTALFWGGLVSVWFAMAIVFTSDNGVGSTKSTPITEQTWRLYKQAKVFEMPKEEEWKEVHPTEKNKWRKLRAIMACESGGKWVVVPVTSSNGTSLGHDTGPCQVNTYYHEDRARTLGYDLMNPTQNMMYCIQLYEEQGNRPRGSNPWDATRACWEQKMSEYVTYDALQAKNN